MSKMKMPEMDVVRFNESDVIVASGDPKTFSLIKVGNGISGDSRIIYMGQEYTDSDGQALADLLNEAVSGSCNPSSGPVDQLTGRYFTWVLRNEDSTSSYDRDGTYEYSGRGFSWVKKQ